MKKIFTVLAVIILTAVNAFPQKVIGYYSSNYVSMPYTAIPYQNLTNICHAFIRPNADGTLTVRPGFLYKEMVEAAHFNNVKVSISLGGWDTVATANFRAFASKPALRHRFVSELTDFCKTNGYDGADIDWEYPDSTDADNFIALISELRKSFDASGIPLISAAIPAQNFRKGFEIDTLKNLLDWFGVMTYDFAGAWENNAYHNSPLYSSTLQAGSIDNSMKHYIALGVPKSKLMIGMAFYGYTMNTADMYQKLSNKVVPALSYIIADSLRHSPDWTYNWDKVTMNPYLQNKAKTQIVTCDDTMSIRLKCEYVKKNDLGGAIIWELHKDYNGSTTPLLNVVGKSLLGTKSALRETIVPADNKQSKSRN